MPDFLGPPVGLNTTSGAGGYTNDAGQFTPFDPNLTNPMDFFLRSIPGTRFAFDEGRRGVLSQAAASGTLNTGGTLKKLNRFGSGFADQVYGDTVGRYLSLADIGLRGATAPFI